MKEFDEYGEPVEIDGQIIDIRPIFQKVLKKWKTVLIWALCGAVLGIVFAVTTPKTYTTKAVIAPELLTRATTSGVSSLASLAGINMNSLALTDAMHPDVYPVIINSTNFYIGLFDLPVTVETRDSVVHTDLYDYMVHYVKRPWFGYVLGAPRIAIGGIKKLFKSKDDIDDAEGYIQMDSLRLTRQQEMVVKTLSKSITATVEKRSYVLTLRVKMQDPVISAQVANATIDNLRDFVLKYRTEKSRENAAYYQKIYVQTRDDYLSAQKAYAYYMDSHQNVLSKSSLVYQQQLQNEAQLRYQMYSQTAQNLLNAEAKIQQEAPVLVVIQPGVAPRMGKPSRVKVTLLWFILGALAGTVFVAVRKESEEASE